MNITGNSSDKVVREERQLYTGLNIFKVEAINPSIEVIREHINPNAEDKRAEYGFERRTDQAKGTRLDIYVSSKDGKVKWQKLTLFMTDAIQTSSKGKTQYIDSIGNTIYYDAEELDDLKKDESKYKWIRKDTLREAYSGEGKLVEFLGAWLNVDTQAEGSMLQLTKPQAIARGNMKEMQEILKAFKDNYVKLLMIVRKADNGSFYQDIYTGMFGVAYLKGTNAWNKAIQGDFDGLKDNEFLQNGSLQFQPFDAMANSSGSNGAANTSLTPQSEGGFEDIGADDVEDLL